jgi:hypothetical protein
VNIFHKTALAVALCLLLAPFALGQSGPADLDRPAEPEAPTDLANPADLPASTDLPASAAPESPAEPETQAEAPAAQAVTENPADEEAPSLSGDDEVEDLEALPAEDLDLEMTVYYDERNGTDYVEIRTPEKIEEYHYLSHIRYSDLIYVLSDLLRRITGDGYQWATAPEISYEKNEEVALLYRRDLVEDMVYGIVQFPDFKVSLSALRKPDVAHRFNAENGRDMMALVFSFASCLAQAEQTLGIKQLEYTMRFFKQD